MTHVYIFTVYCTHFSFCVLQLLLSLPLTATYPCFPWRKDLFFFSLLPSLPPPFCVLLCAKVFWEGYSSLFVFFREFVLGWVKNCFCCGAAKPFETLYMILVCTNKLILTCLQLHHSYKARLCLNQSGSLVHCPSAQLVTFPWFAVICSSLCLLKRSPGIYHEVLIAM